MLDIQECIDKFKDFEQRCKAKRSKQIDRIREDRKFLGGTQWGREDAKLVPKSRGRRTINVVSTSIHSIVNHFGDYPYRWYSPDSKVDGLCDAFLKTGNNGSVAGDVLESTVSFGLGYFCLGSESVTDPDTGEQFEIPALYCMDRLENIYFDPDSVSPSGDDAVEAAIVEMRSKNYIRATYGEEWVTGQYQRPAVNVSDNLSYDRMPIVTYYRVEDGRCTVYTMLNDSFLNDPVQLDISRPPVFPVYGEKTWDGEDDDSVVYQGIVRKSREVQKLINYAFTQLGERLAIAPKPRFKGTPESIEGYEEAWKNYMYTLNPVLLYNDKSPDKKITYPEPQLLDNKVDYGDLTGIISGQLELMSVITGVDARGIMTDNRGEITATEVLYNEREVQNAIRHYFQSLRVTFKAVGEAVVQLLGYGRQNLAVVQGPQEYMQQKVARAELVQLAGIVPEQYRMKIVDGILLTHNDNTVLRNVYGMLHSSPEPTPGEQQALQAVDALKQAVGERDRKIQELEDQVRRYSLAQQATDKGIAADFAKLNLQHQNKMEEMALQAQLNAGGDAVKAEAEAEKAQMGVQKEALSLEREELKTAQAFAQGGF
jgi:hypothetical protein